MEEEILKILGQIVGFVQTTAPEVFEIAVRQVYAIAIRDIFITLFLIAISLFLHKKLNKFMHPKKNEGKEEDVESQVVSWGTVIVAYIVTLIVFLANMSSAIPQLINPKYYAILNLITLVK